MFSNIVYSNKYLELIEKEDKYYIRVFEKGYSMNDFNTIMSQYPRINLTYFLALNSAISNATGEIVEIGIKKPLIELSVSKDRLKGYVILNMTQEEFDNKDKTDVVKLIMEKIQHSNIVYGIDVHDIVNIIQPLKKIQVAQGVLPVRGEDAEITLFKIEDIKPKMVKNDTVNHYELNLINKVNKGAWLGERNEPKPGIPGKTVCGEIIPAQPGRQVELEYDRKTVIEEYNEGEDKTILYAKTTGAVNYQNNIIGVCNCLEIDGDVSFETGNIDFDGFVDIKKSIEDNFVVKADHDIQVMGDMGVGSVDTIESRDGSIYIRGGIAGKNKAKIICNGDLYTKFASECTIECDGIVNIGSYAINCNIKAKEVILESYKSRIIGGNIEAAIKVQAGEIGNRTENYTKVTVTGFERSKIKEEYDTIILTINKVKDKISLLKQKLSIYSNTNLTSVQKKEAEKLNEEFEYYKKNLKKLYEKQKKYVSYLHAKGEGEIKITNCLYPNVSINIKSNTIHNSKYISVPTTFYVLNKELIKA
ncbi:MAG: FapA family protein [Vallitalea sp.]|nr:FapA family protein [Vallitalea sp.]